MQNCSNLLTYYDKIGIKELINDEFYGNFTASFNHSCFIPRPAVWQDSISPADSIPPTCTQLQSLYQKTTRQGTVQMNELPYNGYFIYCALKCCVCVL